MRKIKKRLIELFSSYNGGLLKELTWANIKAYDHHSVPGILWSLLNPLVMLAVLYAVFSGQMTGQVPFYPLYLLVGIVTVNFFINVTSKVIRTIPTNREILLNSTMLRENFILADVAVDTYKFVIELILCWSLGFYYGLFAWESVFLAVPLLAAYAGLVAGVGFIVALMHCFASDVEHIWRIVSRLFLFVTPVFYQLENVTPVFSKIIYWANPLTPFLIGFRQLIMSPAAFDWANYTYCLILGAVTLCLGHFIFVIFENKAMEQV